MILAVEASQQLSFPSSLATLRRFQYSFQHYRANEYYSGLLVPVVVAAGLALAAAVGASSQSFD